MPEFLEKLKNLTDQDFDLFITVTQKVLDIEYKIKQFKSDAKILVVQNKGYDIFPFLSVINQINLDDYDYVIKLHTKRLNGDNKTQFHNIMIDDKTWSESLVNALIGCPTRVKNNISKFQQNKNVGMLGHSLCIVDNRDYFIHLLPKINQSLKKIGFSQISANDNFKFVAGTMFIMKASLLKVMQNKFTIDDFEESDTRIKDLTAAHAIERVFGIITEKQGYKIYGNCKVKTFLLILKFKNGMYKKHISRRGNLSIRLFGVAIFYKSLLNKDEKLFIKSGLFDHMWYYQTYLANKREKQIPIRHYLNKGKKLGFAKNKEEFEKQERETN